jgi:hypothetical protein
LEEYDYFASPQHVRSDGRVSRWPFAWVPTIARHGTTVATLRPVEAREAALVDARRWIAATVGARVLTAA